MQTTTRTQWFCHLWDVLNSKKNVYLNLTNGKVLNPRWPPMTIKEGNLYEYFHSVYLLVYVYTSIKCGKIHLYNVLMSEL